MSGISCKEGVIIAEPKEGIDPFPAETALLNATLEEFCNYYCTKECMGRAWGPRVVANNLIYFKVDEVARNVPRQFEPPKE